MNESELKVIGNFIDVMNEVKASLKNVLEKLEDHVEDCERYRKPVIKIPESRLLN